MSLQRTEMERMFCMDLMQISDWDRNGRMEAKILMKCWNTSSSSYGHEVAMKNDSSTLSKYLILHNAKD